MMGGSLAGERTTGATEEEEEEEEEDGGRGNNGLAVDNLGSREEEDDEEEAVLTEAVALDPTDVPTGGVHIPAAAASEAAWPDKAAA